LRGEKDFFVELAVYFPEFHEEIEEKINTLNAPFLKLRGPSPTRALALAITDDLKAATQIWRLGNYYCMNALHAFPLDGFCTDHIKTLQEISVLYANLTHFEPDLKRRAALHARRLAMLSPLIGEISQQHFLSKKILGFSIPSRYGAATLL